MDKLIEDFLNQKRFAVAGSFRNTDKVAYKILKDLKGLGYQVFPVNPGMSTVDGSACYKRISDIPYDIDVVNIVTPPAVTMTILKECPAKGIRRVWLQPGAENRDTIDFCYDNKISVVYNVCVMLESLKR
jgi:uncharacterized protein